MNHYTYEVIKESPGFHGHVSDIEVLDRFDNPGDALRMCDTLRKNADDGWFYVQVQWGSIDNV